MSDAHPFRDRAAIVGVGRTEYSRNSGVSTLTLALRAIKAALDDAGLTVADVDGVACHRVGDSAQAAVVAQSLGIRDLRSHHDLWGGGSQSMWAVGSAAMAVATGMAECVVVWRSVKARSVLVGLASGPADGVQPAASSSAHIAAVVADHLGMRPR